MFSTYQAWQINPISKSNDETNLAILENLNLKEVDKPAPSTGQALIRIHAVALNYADLLVVANSPKYPKAILPGLSPCCDGTGSVEAVGSDSRWKIGDEVIFRVAGSWKDGDVSSFDGLVLGGGDVQGTLQQYRVLDDHWLVEKPQYLSWAEAAAISGTGGTAVNALFHSGVSNGMDLSGKTILTQGTGGVSLSAIQLAVAAGAKVIATSSSDAKLELLKRIGAQDVINYTTHPDWAAEVLRLTGGRGVDLVVEVGGSGTIEQSLKASRFGGTLVLVGFLTASHKVDIGPQIIFGAKTGMLCQAGLCYQC